MGKIVKGTEIQEVFTKYCQHRNMNALMVSQEVFQRGPNA